jgi:hypothetical protein
VKVKNLSILSIKNGYKKTKTKRKKKNGFEIKIKIKIKKSPRSNLATS